MARKGSFAELQEQTALSLTWQDIDGARAAIKAMREFVAMAERDLEKLIAWTRAAEEAERLAEARRRIADLEAEVDEMKQGE